MGSNQGMPNCPWKQIFYLECCFWVECKPKWISKMAILIHHTTTWIISHLSPSILLIRRRSYNLQIHMQMQKTGKWNKWSVPRSFASYTFELNKHYGMCGILLNNWDYKFHQNIQQIVVCMKFFLCNFGVMMPFACPLTIFCFEIRAIKQSNRNCA